MIRVLTRSDLSQLHAINEACVPEVNRLSADALWEISLVAREKLAFVDPISDELLGFVYCLDHDADYSSVNFCWVKERYDRFAYVDRIAISDKARGRGAGRALYTSLIERLGHIYPMLACEVNERPPNPVSMAFHSRMGFEIIGHADIYDGAHRVAYMARTL